MKPSTPCVIGAPALGETTTGSSDAIASATAPAEPSQVLGRQKTSNLPSHAATSDRGTGPTISAGPRYVASTSCGIDTGPTSTNRTPVGTNRVANCSRYGTPLRTPTLPTNPTLTGPLRPRRSGGGILPASNGYGSTTIFAGSTPHETKPSRTYSLAQVMRSA